MEEKMEEETEDETERQHHATKKGSKWRPEGPAQHPTLDSAAVADPRVVDDSGRTRTRVTRTGLG